MIISRQTTLKPLLESKEGVHLTAYLVNRGDLVDLKSQLRTTISETYEWIYPAMSADERKKFLEPLDSLLNDARIFKQIKGNVGIFRNEESFRVLNIPITVERSCQVATSFHVKPLLRWLQGDQEFLFLGLETESAYLYLGSQDTFKLIDSIRFPEFLRARSPTSNSQIQRDARKSMRKQAETFLWINNWILDQTKNYKPKLFLGGDPSLVHALNKCLDYKNVGKNSVSNFFSKNDTFEVCHKIRAVMKEESRKSLQDTLLDFRFAEEDGRTKKNIFQISKAVVQGKVRKLIVTDEISIFGKIDQKSGGLSIHPFDIDHEDDCILDDLAQMVLSRGGEVVVAKRDEIPKGRPILAILDEGGGPLGKAIEFQNESIHTLEGRTI